MDQLRRFLRWWATRADRRLDRLEAAESEKQRRHEARIESLRGQTVVGGATADMKASLAQEIGN